MEKNEGKRGETGTYKKWEKMGGWMDGLEGMIGAEIKWLIDS
jgi:hypothetical protein